MPEQPAELWAFYLAAASVVAILVVAVGAAVIVSHQKITAATRAYAARQVDAIEEDRGRVARDLHDDVSQHIAALSQQVEAIQESLPDAADPGLHGATEAVGDGLRDLATTVRALAHRMHPSVLDHLGLGPALQSLAREMAAGTTLEIRVEVPQDPDLDRQHALALYRITQEGLHNVQKHAGASQVRVRIAQSGQGTTLEISDDGVGFFPQTAMRSNGLGLASMRERIRLLGGELRIGSSPGHGTSVWAWLPRSNGEGTTG
jgi:two-component system NarL family sensor kinase